MAPLVVLLYISMKDKRLIRLLLLACQLLNGGCRLRT